MKMKRFEGNCEFFPLKLVNDEFILEYGIIPAVTSYTTDTKAP